MKLSPQKLCFTLFLALFCMATSAHADAGLPMLVIIWPGYWLALIPIITIETYYLSKRTGKRPVVLIWAVTLANLFSTVLGYPLVWTMLLVLELVTTHGNVFGLGTINQAFVASVVQAAWLAPDESNMVWMVPIAAFVNLFFAFILSIFSEAWIFSKILKMPMEQARKLSRGANTWSYVFLTILLLVIWKFNFIEWMAIPCMRLLETVMRLLPKSLGGF